MDNKKIVRLDVYSWAGLSLGAIHYYVKLSSWDWNDDRGGRLAHPLTKAQASRINKVLRDTYSDEYYNLYKVEPGDMHNGFDTKKQAIDEALRQWLIIFPEADMLVDAHDPRKVYAVRDGSNQEVGKQNATT